MDATKSFKEFLNDLRSAFPDVKFNPFREDQITEFEEWCTPNILKILQKDGTLFTDPCIVFNVDISPLYASQTAMIWKHVQHCAMASFLSGDLKGKLSKVLDSLKTVWGGAGHNTDEIDKLIGNEETQDKISELIEFVMNTRLATIVTSMMENINLDDLGIDFESPEDVMNMFQNMNGNPTIQKVMKKVQGILEEKLRKGDFTKEMIVQDFETIREKLKAAFGDMFNDMLGGRRADVPTQVLMGNSPEARRARMIARLQRKVKERKTQ
jgi:hypothetical protein